MATVPLYKCRHGNVAIVRFGTTMNFNSGRYWTLDKRQNKILAWLAANRQQGVYIDPNEPEIDPNAATPYDVMKKKIIDEYLKEQGVLKDYGETNAKAAINPMGTNSSPIMNNGAAEIVATESTQAAPANSALAALEALKNKGSEEPKS